MKRLLVISAVLLVLPCVAFAGTLPDTGQTKCYDNTQEIICPSPGEDFYGQDAQYAANQQSYTKLDSSGNDLPDEATEWVMIRDNVTGLIWEVKTDDDSTHDKDGLYNWQDAQDIFIATVNNENFGGYADWRLPMVKELASIVNRDQVIPAINTMYFPNTMSQLYWTSSAFAEDPAVAWEVDFFHGNTTEFLKQGTLYVRAVRGEQWGSNSFIDNADGTVTNTKTGLMWQKDTPSSIYTWQDALYYCENLTLAGYSDWRLPNMNELHSLVDYTHISPCIDSIFPNTVSSLYWSSTTNSDYGYAAFLVDFNIGDVASQDKSFINYSVRAVRGGMCGSYGDADGDTVCDNADNCINVYNPGQEDRDGDGISDVCDSCPRHPNSSILGICVGAFGLRGKTCISNEECGSGGVCCMNQSCASGCDCKSNFDCDYDVDGTDASRFKSDFGRSLFHDPCISQDTCHGDFECDGDVDGMDAADFKKYFGVSPLGGYCLSCVDGVYQYSCSY